jgi:hypothetical protein
MTLIDLTVGGVDFSQYRIREDTQDFPLFISEECLKGMHVTEDLSQAGTYFFFIMGERLEQFVQSCAITFCAAVGSDTGYHMVPTEMHYAKVQSSGFLRDC